MEGSMSKEKKNFFSSFEITDRESCEKAIRNGGVAALISAGITAIFGILGFFIQSADANLSYMLDPWILVDVIFVVVLAIFIFRKSRVASTLLLAYFTVSKVIMWIDIGAPRGIILSVIFFLYFLTAMRGTYAWHSEYRDLPIERTA
jgi:hypothetical protein